MIRLFKPNIADDAMAFVGAVLRSDHIAQGPRVDLFERELQRVMGCADTQSVVTVNSGTSAIHLALVLAGVRPGDLVAVSPMTCAATIVPILHLGALPLWIDVDAKTGLMDPASLAWRLTSNTRAIIAVDWAGVPCDYLRLHEAAHGIPIIEDAAHAFLARDVGNVPIARMASSTHLIAHSFQAIKHLTTGDGGALIVPDGLVERARRLRWFGFDRTSSKDFRCAQSLEEAGYKFHMNDIAAAIGLANLPMAEFAVWTHREHALQYHQQLDDLGPRVELAPYFPGASYWIYTLLVDDRDKFQAYMSERGIETSQVHRRNDEHPVFQRHAASRHHLPGLDEFAKHQVAIPVGAHLTQQDLFHVIEAVKEYAS